MSGVFPDAPDTEEADVLPAPRRRNRLLAALGAAAFGIGVLGQSAVAVADTGPTTTDPVDVALVRPGALDSLVEVDALARRTTGRTGVVVGVVIDRNGGAAGGIAVERIVAEPVDVAALTEHLDGIDGVFSAAPDQRVTLAADPLDASEYGPTRIGARSLAPTTDGRGTTVAVVDTGVTGTHPDLLPALPDGRARISTGTSFLSGDPANHMAGNVDPHGHGTHVAGIITAARGNNLGGSGVAPGAQVLPVRVLNSSGSGWSSDVTAGVLWAHQQGADVINLSLGAPGTTPRDLDTAITFVTTDRTRGKPPTVVVAAAGNNGPTSAAVWPGAHPQAIAVAATDAVDAVAPFSSRGSYVDVAAPGVGIVSTCRDGGQCSMSGTSMATPMVAGASAVLRQVDPTMDPARVKARLESTAVDLGPAGPDTASGAGRIDLVAAVGAGSAPASPPSTLLTGNIDHATVDRRRIIMGGTAYDPDGLPVVRIVAVTNGRLSVHNVAAGNGSWEATWSDGTGSAIACASATDTPTNATVLLGCRQFVVK
jgi:serine protease